MRKAEHSGNAFARILVYTVGFLTCFSAVCFISQINGFLLDSVLTSYLSVERRTKVGQLVQGVPRHPFRRRVPCIDGRRPRPRGTEEDIRRAPARVDHMGQVQPHSSLALQLVPDGS